MAAARPTARYGWLRQRFCKQLPREVDGQSGVRFPPRPYRSFDQFCWLQFAIAVGDGIGPGACEQTSVAVGPSLFAASAPEPTATNIARAIEVLVNMVASPDRIVSHAHILCGGLAV